MDERDDFEEQARSWEHLQNFGPQLVSEASKIIAAHPEPGALAGLVTENGTAEFNALARKLAPEGADLSSRPGLAGIIPRQLAEQIAGAPGKVWLDENAPIAGDKLGVVAVLRKGVRFAAFDLPPSDA
jgi:stage V sporulation protein SpoVS